VKNKNSPLDNLPATKSDLREFRREINSRFDNLANLINGLAKLIKSQMDEFEVHKLTHQRHQEQLDDHEKRIVRLEEVISAETPRCS